MSCCPSETKLGQERLGTHVKRDIAAPHRAVLFPEKQIKVGTDRPIIAGDGEKRRSGGKVSAFMVDPYAVTVQDFGRFIAGTGYVTDAQRYGWSLVFHTHVKNSVTKDRNCLRDTPWWIKVEGADWQHWTGQSDDTSERANHPVTHVSWNDASAYAAWVGGRLPREAEWEYAAGGGTDKRYPWGDVEPENMAQPPLRIFEGKFPSHPDTTVGPVDVDSHEPNAAGLFNFVGNAWEWVEDSYTVKSISKASRLRNDEAKRTNARVLKGGSHLCHKSYCWRFRTAARSSASADSSTAHAGFRVFYNYS